MNIKEKIIDWKKDVKIDKDCIIRGMPSEVYHRKMGLSTSGIKKLLECPYKYYSEYILGKKEEKSTPALEFGKAAHKYILEGEKEFKKEYYCGIFEKYKKNELIEKLKELGYEKEEIKSLKIEELKEYLYERAGIDRSKEEIKPDDLNKILEMKAEIDKNPLASGAFRQEGESELSIFWKDQKSGMWLKCRPDYLPYDCLNIPDYKTAESVEPVKFYNNFIDFGYHIQSSMYAQGIKAVSGIEVNNFFFVAQEKKSPYIAQIFCPDDYLVRHGEKAIRTAIEKYKECENKNKWDTYSDHIIQLSVEPKPEDCASRWDRDSAICYAPNWIDSLLEKNL